MMSDTYPNRNLLLDSAVRYATPEELAQAAAVQAAETGWRYHSALAVPKPLDPPADPDAERMWAAVQELGKR